MTIQQLVNKYESNRDYYLKSTYNETLLRSDFLDTFFELLGWDIKNIAGKPNNEREVILEEPLKENVSVTSKKPDYTFRLFAERKFFVEAKKPFIKIHNNDETARQVRRYGYTAKLKISVLSNFEHLIIYDCSEKVNKEDNYNKSLIHTYHYTEYVDKFEEIKQFLGHDAVYSGSFDITWEKIESQIKLHNVDDLFLEHINKWRILLGKEIIKFKSDITDLELNDFVQSYINSIIFLRVCEDRNLEEYQTLLNFANQSDFKALINKFQQADHKYNSGLFEQTLSNEIIKNISSVFWLIIKELYYPENPYSFSVFASDILGNIYEIFLADKLVIIDNEIQLIPKPENVDKDVITTPTFIINDILRQTLVPYCKGKTDIEILLIKLADIACGSGALLLESYQLFNDVLIDYYLKNDKTKLIQTSINTYKLPFNIKKEILLKCIYGVDKDYNAVEAAKFGLLLKLLENEDKTSTGSNIPILPDLSNNIFFGNSLIDSVKDDLIQLINPFDFGDLKFDIIVGNPPYMKAEDMKTITPIEYPIYNQKYKTAYKQYDKYFLFIERSISLLKDNGILGYIVPNKFMKVGAAQKLRGLLSENKLVSNIISFGANQIFGNKTTYTCILILNKSENEECKYYEVKKLTDWKIRDYSQDDFDTISSDNLNENVWALVPGYLKNIYNSIISQSITLEELVGSDNIFNGIQTSANNIYILKSIREDDDYIWFIKNKKEYQIEKSFLKPYFETPRNKDEDGLYTYRPFQPNRYVIYPYQQTEEGLEFIEIEDLKQNFPFAYAYLIENKKELAKHTRDIKPTPKTENEWYRYGRHQSLENCDVPAKIIVGVLSVGDKYAIDFHQTLISSGGTAGYCMITLPAKTDYSIYYIQAILNSKYLEWFSALYGEVFRGGYIARGTKVLMKLPIRKINFEKKQEKKLHETITENQKNLISLQQQIDDNQNNKRQLIILQRQFDTLLATQNNIIKNLYNIHNDNIIPSIKELYAAN